MVGKGLYINIGLTPLDTSEVQVRRMVEVGARPCAVENSGILGTICWQIILDNHSKLEDRQPQVLQRTDCKLKWKTDMSMFQN